MSGQSTSTLSALLRPNVQSGVVDLSFRGADFVDLLRAGGRISDLQGPSPHSWNIVTSSNSSVEIFTEGQAPPAAGRQTFTQTSLNAFYVRGVAGETGHTRDNRKKGGYYEDPFNAERMLLDADIFKKLDDELMGSTADRGIASCVDSSGTYANVAAATVTQWASEENAVGGALTIDALQTLYEEMHFGTNSSVPRGATPTHWLMPVNQITNYVNTVGPVAGTTASFWRHASGQQFDAGLQQGLGGPSPAASMNGLPIMKCRGMTTTEIYLVDLQDIELLIHRDLEIAPITGNPEMDSYQVSASFLFKISHRNHHGKMTGVTA
jgi:hypothetical protein